MAAVKHPMNSKTFFSWQSEVNIYAVQVNNPQMAAHHTTFAFNLKHIDVKEKYTQFMKDSYCENKLGTMWPCLFTDYCWFYKCPGFPLMAWCPQKTFFNWCWGKPHLLAHLCKEVLGLKSCMFAAVIVKKLLFQSANSARIIFEYTVSKVIK